MANIDLKTLMWDKSLTQTDIANIMGVNQSVVSKFIRGQRCPLKHHIEKLEAHFGSEIIKYYSELKKTTEMVQSPISTPNKPFEEITQPAEGTLLTPEVVEEIKEEIKEEVRQEIKEKIEDVESFLIVPEVVNAEPNANIEEVIEEDGTELEAISPNLLLSDMKVSVAEQIKGTSMLPTFQPNDWVFIRFLKDTMKIVSGKTYYLKCRNRPTMIRMVKFEGEDKLRLIAKNSEYDDIVIYRSDIINIGNVVALFRMTFGDQYSQLEALRRHKDEQLEERHQQINNFIDIQREMVAEIREQGKRNERERERTDRLIEKIINQ